MMPKRSGTPFFFGKFALEKDDSVGIFLLGKGVESKTLDSEKFSVTGQMKLFVEAGGEILACGTCLKIRQSDVSESAQSPRWKISTV